jgi:hypothetical protein
VNAGVHPKSQGAFYNGWCCNDCAMGRSHDADCDRVNGCFHSATDTVASAQPAVPQRSSRFTRFSGALAAAVATTPPTGGTPMPPEHADGLDERPLPVAAPQQPIAERVRNGLRARMTPLHAAMAAYNTPTTGNAAQADEAMVDEVTVGSEAGSITMDDMDEWGVTVVDAPSDVGSGTEDWEAPIAADYDIGDGMDPAVIANVLHAIEVNETQLSPALQTMAG